VLQLNRLPFEPTPRSLGGHQRLINKQNANCFFSNVASKDAIPGLTQTVSTVCIIRGEEARSVNATRKVIVIFDNSTKIKIYIYIYI